jgi:hypothetical protein
MGAPERILGSSGQVMMIRVEVKRLILFGKKTNSQSVAKIDRLHDRNDLMISVGPKGADVQKEVDLRGRIQNDFSSKCH